MRHRKARRKLGRTTEHREALLRNLTTSLLLHERIITTQAKAKELRKIAERMITLAKREDLHARRQAAEVVQDERVLKKLFDALGGRYQGRNGGYTRVLRTGMRRGDGTQKAVLEFSVPIEIPTKEKKPKREKKPKPSKAIEAEKEAKPKKVPKVEKEKSETEIQKEEAQKRGGFLSKLRKFLTGEEEKK